MTRRTAAHAGPLLVGACLATMPMTSSCAAHVKTAAARASNTNTCRCAASEACADSCAAAAAGGRRCRTGGAASCGCGGGGGCTAATTPAAAPADIRGGQAETSGARLSAAAVESGAPVHACATERSAATHSGCARPPARLPRCDKSVRTTGLRSQARASSLAVVGFQALAAPPPAVQAWRPVT